MITVESLEEFTPEMKEIFGQIVEMAELADMSGVDWSLLILEPSEAYILAEKIEELGGPEIEEEILGWGRFYCFILGNAGDGLFVAVKSAE